ncbi:unnamed protein product [Phytophthora fragariaefolia]|uniref:Unnamed protein product n=1 Tax=Phytophthora fragariaefolia TaxID=1490495 RepID=A0A9W6XYA7_9STRA|nr:unnamed protein product [Phytophthora fragariaefolia]
MPTFLLPVTQRSLAFTRSVLHFCSCVSSPPVKFLVSAESRDLECSLRAQFPDLFASHEHETIPNHSDPKDLQAALGRCEGTILVGSGCGDDVINLPSNPADEWLECERNVARLVTGDHRVLKLSWSQGFVGERSPSAVGRANYEVEMELKQTFQEGKKWAHNLFILRAPTGMDALLRGRMFELVCGRTLSTSVKTGRIAFDHPLDVAESLSALVLGKGEGIGDQVVTLTGPEALTFKQVAKVLTKGIGDKVNYSCFPLWAVQPARWVRGVPGDVIEEELAVIRALEAGAQQTVETQVAEKMLGRNLRSLYEFIAENSGAWPRADPQ